MIIQLYTFSPGSYVIAEDWNANFRVLYKTNVSHEEAVVDAQALIAFPNSDLTDLFAAINNQLNSFAIAGNVVTVSAESEYYKTLSSGQELVINIPSGICAGVRIIFRIQEDRSLKPFTINYDGTIIENAGDITQYTAGTYFMFIYETNDIAQIKIVKTTGV